MHDWKILWLKFGLINCTGKFVSVKFCSEKLCWEGVNFPPGFSEFRFVMTIIGIEWCNLYIVQTYFFRPTFRMHSSPWCFISLALRSSPQTSHILWLGNAEVCRQYSQYLIPHITRKRSTNSQSPNNYWTWTRTLTIHIRPKNTDLDYFL